MPIAPEFVMVLVVVEQIPVALMLQRYPLMVGYLLDLDDRLSILMLF